MSPAITSTDENLGGHRHGLSVYGRDMRPRNLVENSARVFLTASRYGQSLRGNQMRSAAMPVETLQSVTMSNQDAAHRGALDVTPPPQLRPQSATLHALQEWEGYVLEKTATTFTARLADLTNGVLHEEEEADIPLAELADHQIASVRRGAIFRWVIGYEQAPMRPLKRVSVIVFRDLPIVTESDLRAGDAWARDVLQAFGS